MAAPSDAAVPVAACGGIAAVPDIHVAAKESDIVTTPDKEAPEAKVAADLAAIERANLFRTPRADTLVAPQGCTVRVYVTTSCYEAKLTKGLKFENRNSCTRYYGVNRSKAMAYAEVHTLLCRAVASGVVRWYACRPRECSVMRVVCRPMAGVTIEKVMAQQTQSS